MGGKALFDKEKKKDGGALDQVLKEVYPDFSWDASRFLSPGKVSRQYWWKKQNIQRALNIAEERLDIKMVRSLY